jgi:hypothetical protein
MIKKEDPTVVSAGLPFKSCASLNALTRLRYPLPPAMIMTDGVAFKIVFFGFLQKHGFCVK